MNVDFRRDLYLSFRSGPLRQAEIDRRAQATGNSLISTSSADPKQPRRFSFEDGQSKWKGHAHGSDTLRDASRVGPLKFENLNIGAARYARCETINIPERVPGMFDRRRHQDGA